MARHVIVVPARSQAGNLKELIDMARREPDRISYASSGAGSIQHLGTELLKQMSKISMLHVPYKGATPAIADLLEDCVQLFITTPPSMIGHIQGSRLRALAIASPTRHPMLPDVPTTADAGFAGYELEAWVAVFGPAGMPPEITQRLTSEISKLVAEPEFQPRIEKQGTYPRYLPPADLGAKVQQDLAYWSKVIKAADIRLD